jgi:small subunit ribosomal protein S2
MNYSRSLGHFLEQRSNFLKSISEDVTKWNKNSRESGLISTLHQAVAKVPDISVCSNDLAVSTMLRCSMHIGHSKSYWNPQMSRYIFGERAGIHIIDLDKTLACLRQAATVTAQISQRNGKILFVGTKPELQRLTYESASYCDQFYVNRRWIGGTISNSKNIIGTEARPDLVIVLDMKRNSVAVKECFSANVPLIAICDTDCDPRMVTYPIPANDEALASVELVAKFLAIAAKKGKEGKAIV